MTASDRRFLVVVRAGEKSMHRRWLEGGARNWDLVVSWYGDAPYVPVADETVLTASGWKWDVLARQFAERPDLVAGYDYIWIPDDDLDTSAARISSMFELTARHGFSLSQPALSADSYFSHLHTVVCPSFELRFTDFVEAMAPCFSRETLMRIMPFMGESPSGYGLDLLWTRLEEDNRFRAAILDRTPMRHTRAVGRFLKVRMENADRSPHSDGTRILARFGLDWQMKRFHCYAGIGRTGRPRGRMATALWMLVDYLRVLPGGIEPRRWHLYLNAIRRLPGGPRLDRVERVAD